MPETFLTDYAGNLANWGLAALLLRLGCVAIPFAERAILIRFYGLEGEEPRAGNPSRDLGLILGASAALAALLVAGAYAAGRGAGLAAAAGAALPGLLAARTLARTRREG